jgi:poly-gamma-glutamate synthesis protein (capsule biosynthesis protein)
MNPMPSVSSFNWERGSWSDPSAGTPEISLCVAGDWAPIRRFRSVIETTPAAVYGDLLPSIQSADLSIVNLEAALSDRGAPVSKSGSVFKGEEKHIAGLTAVPFDVVTLANNHVFDYGPDAFQDSLALLTRNHIQYVGAGLSWEEAAKPLVVDIKGIKIGIVNFSEGEDLTAAEEDRPGVMGWDLDAVCRTIKTLKRDVNFILAVCHCGIEYIPFPPPYVADAFRRVAEAGADVVIGHHPHVPQGIAFHNNIPICHSLGNFVFYQETDLNYRKVGYMVKIGIKRESLVSIELVPYRINEKGLLAMGDWESKTFFKKLKEISLPLDDTKRVEDAWYGFLHHFGTKGFFEEISMIMERLEGDPKKGAAMFRNRLTTLQHYHHWKDLMTRIVDGTLECSPGWARDLTQEWLNTNVPSH